MLLYDIVNVDSTDIKEKDRQNKRLLGRRELPVDKIIASEIDEVNNDIDNIGFISNSGEGTETYYSLKESDPEDRKTLAFLNSQPTQRVYRAMQLIDGKLYPPMAARVKDNTGKKQLVEASELGRWEQSVERPDLIKAGNRFNLDKANGTSLNAAYNPYFHTSRSPLNDQFMILSNHPLISNRRSGGEPS